MGLAAATQFVAVALDLPGELVDHQVHRVQHLRGRVLGAQGDTLQVQRRLGYVAVGDAGVALHGQLDLQAREVGDLPRYLRQTPFRVRFKVPLTVAPPVIGIAVAIALWDEQGEPDFFLAATHVLALGAVALALQGRFFRLAPHRGAGVAGAYVGLNVLGVLVAIGLGLFFSFHALAAGHSRTPDLAATAGSLAAGIGAFGVQAIFGTPGMEEEQDS